jgi:hypothetical protein
LDVRRLTPGRSGVLPEGKTSWRTPACEREDTACSSHRPLPGAWGRHRPQTSRACTVPAALARNAESAPKKEMGHIWQSCHIMQKRCEYVTGVNTATDRTVHYPHVCGCSKCSRTLFAKPCFFCRQYRRFFLMAGFTNPPGHRGSYGDDLCASLCMSTERQFGVVSANRHIHPCSSRWPMCTHTSPPSRQRPTPMGNIASAWPWRMWAMERTGLGR